MIEFHPSLTNKIAQILKKDENLYPQQAFQDILKVRKNYINYKIYFFVFFLFSFFVRKGIQKYLMKDKIV